MTGRVVVVTGTSTGVGKTIATAALASIAAAAGEHVTVVKPVQTGLALGDSDAATVHRLTGLGAQELTGLDEPLAPETAALRAGTSLPPVSEYADRVRVLAELHDTVLVEGAGGLLVRLDLAGGTLRDLAAELAVTHEVQVVVVASAGLGTLNHTGLTIEALRTHGLEPAGLVLGAWPDHPDLAMTTNLADLPRVTGVPLLGAVPQGAGALSREEFVAGAASWVRTPPSTTRRRDSAHG